MYPVRLGYTQAVSRIQKLMKNGHHPEALVSCAFTVEKTLRRTLREIVVSAGFASKQADKIVRGCNGLEALKRNWEIYDPNNKALTDIVPKTDWAQFRKVATMRNKMVHGERVYELATCKTESKVTLVALDRLKNSFDQLYGYSGWTTYSRRIKHTLHSDPKVRT
jgi:hypothetical protein